MKKMIKRLRNERGLTLVELLAVVVILAIIAVIAFVFIGGIIENSKKDAHIANAQQIISAAKIHEATGGDLSGGITVAQLKNQKYLDVVLDPWEKDPYTDLTAEVVKDGDNAYTINGFSDDGDNCSINGKTETDLSKEDRETICGVD